MTLDEIITALQEWRGDDKERSYVLISTDNRKVKVAVKGNDFLLSCALAGAMVSEKSAESIVQGAMALKNLGLFFNENDNDDEE